MPQKNFVTEMTIEDITHEGNGIGRLKDGMAVFVPHTAAGDRIRVRIVKVNKTHCFGRLEELLEPSAHRSGDAGCPVFLQCGGCAFRHVRYEAELGYKQNFVEQNLRRIGGTDCSIEPILPSPQVDGYRNKAQYPIRLQQGELCAGFFAPRSHRVIDGRSCALQPAVFGEALETVLAFMGEYGIAAYDEAAGTGVVRHLYLRRGARSEELMVCLVVNLPAKEALPGEEQLLRRLDRLPGLASVLLNYNTRRDNVVLGAENRVLFGSCGIEDILCGVRLFLAPPAFYQVNSPAAELLYGLAADYACLTGGETLLDLYCGAGAIGLSMAGRCAQVIGVEAIPQAVENARENAARNRIANARFLCADAGEAAGQLLKEGVRPDVVVLDPPRKGCDAPTLTAVAGMAPSRIVYISCNSATLARDIAFLRQSGYRAEKARPVDLFPRTIHVETVALLSRGEIH